MKITIGTHSISDIVTSAQLVESCPSESEAITLSGKRQIDRMGSFKTNLNLVIGKVKYTRWKTIAELLKMLPVSVTIAMDNSSTAYSMCLDGELPTPYIYTDADGDYCAGISLALKEVG